jgi:pyrroline-5-carboxylate reductase
MKIAIIGCGVIGSTLAKHLSSNHQLLLFDRKKETARALADQLKAKAVESASQAMEAECVILAIKPRDLASFASGIKGNIEQGKILISVLSGTSLTVLKNFFSKFSYLCRIMPNTPMSVGEGVIALCCNAEVPAEVKGAIESLFSGLGLLMSIEEDKFDAFTALAGSSPAFIFLLVEAFIESGIFLGFSPADAKKIALQVIKGSAELLMQTKRHPAELKWEVASPGGTTIAGLMELESQHFRAAFQKAILATYEKSRIISQEQVKQAEIKNKK